MSITVFIIFFLCLPKTSFAQKNKYMQFQERELKTLIPINVNSSKIDKSMSNNKNGNNLQDYTFQQPLYIKRWHSNIVLQNIASEFNFFAENLAKKLRVPGMAIALVTKDKILLKKTYGVKKIGLASFTNSTSTCLSKEKITQKNITNNKIDDNTIFRLGSVSKTLTSYLIYKLCNKEIKINYREKLRILRTPILLPFEDVSKNYQYSIKNNDISNNFIYTGYMFMDKNSFKICKKLSHNTRGNIPRFNIDCSIIDFLPKDVYISDIHFTKKIKIKHILSHSCGTHRYRLEKIAYKDQPLEVLLEKLKHIGRYCNKPGTYFAYQNVIFSLIAPILESCFREKYSHIFKLNILHDLKLNNTIICQKEYLLAKNKALPHIMYLKSYKNISVDSYYDNILPAGGISSSIHDMAKFIMHVLKDEEYINFVESYTVNASSKIDKIEKHDYNKEAYNKIRSWQYGIGWYLENYNGSKVIFHGGRLTGFRTMVQFLPKYNIGFVIITNSSSGRLCTILRHKLSDLVYSGVSLSA